MAPVSVHVAFPPRTVVHWRLESGSAPKVYELGARQKRADLDLLASRAQPFWPVRHPGRMRPAEQHHGKPVARNDFETQVGERERGFDVIAVKVSNQSAA